MVQDLNESFNDYPHVIGYLGDSWRVIECRDGVQWVLQKRIRLSNSMKQDCWRGRSFCRSKEALLRCIQKKVGLDKSGDERFMVLPNWIEGPYPSISKRWLDQKSDLSVPNQPDDAK